MTDREQRRLHDYLDGRLDAQERAEFERRLGADPELARRVRTIAEFGRALREGAPELSPTFYEQTRRRFEERSRRDVPLHFRLLSWEAAGLAAAAALVAALFVPQLLHEEVALRPAPTETEQEFSPAPVPAPETEPAPPARRLDTDRQESFAPAPASPSPETKPLPQRAASQPPIAEPGVVSKLSASASVERLSAAAAPDARTALPVVPVPRGIVAEESIQTIEEPDAWEALVFGADRALVALGPHDPRRRIVLIGGGLDCSTLEAIPTPQAWEIRVESLADSASGGCAFTLPRDGRAVRRMVQR